MLSQTCQHRRLCNELLPRRGDQRSPQRGATAFTVVHRGSYALIGSARRKSAARTTMIVHVDKAWHNEPTIPLGSSGCITISGVIRVDECVNNAIHQGQRRGVWRIHTVIEQSRDIAVE